mgnify:CR=1 FL=1
MKRHFYKKETKEHIWILVFCVSIIALTLLFSVNEENKVCFFAYNLYQLPETCFFKVVIGVKCPFCYMTRSFISISHLDFERAWNFNKLGVFIYALIILQIPYRIIIILRRLNSRADYGRYKKTSSCEVNRWHDSH